MSMRTGTVVRVITGVPPRMSGFPSTGSLFLVASLAVDGAAFGFCLVKGQCTSLYCIDG